MKYKKLLVILNTFLPLILGAIVGIFMNDLTAYNESIKAPLTPPNIVFPIVWSILYLLMGISSSIILVSQDEEKKEALSIYYIQLFINLFWSIIFFVHNMPLLAFLWIILLIIAVITMIRKFYDINKLAAYLQIPYLIWIIFASYLNLAFYLLNR